MEVYGVEWIHHVTVVDYSFYLITQLRRLYIVIYRQREISMDGIHCNSGACDGMVMGARCPPCSLSVLP